jgi:hypothetical protein
VDREQEQEVIDEMLDLLMRLGEGLDELRDYVRALVLATPGAVQAYRNEHHGDWPET